MGEPPRHTRETDTADEHLVWDVERLWELARGLPAEDVPVEQVRGYLSGVWTTTPQTGRDLADHSSLLGHPCDGGAPPGRGGGGMRRCRRGRLPL